MAEEVKLGPWNVGAIGDGYVYGDEFVPGTPVEGENYTVALALGDSSDLDHEAHARLIAAAPQLLEVLTLLWEAHGVPYELAGRVEQAIARATGRK